MQRLVGNPMEPKACRYADHPKLRAIEIVEYIPEFDKDLRTAHLVRDLVVALKKPALATLAKAS